MRLIENKLPQWAIVNFIVLTLLGVVLRYMQIYGLSFINYPFLLHAHSHFAFSGWMFFAIALLITQTITGNEYNQGFRYVFILNLISAYGMLVSFYLQGYKPVSICFSTLFILVNYTFTYLVFKSKPLKTYVNEVGCKLIKGGLIFLCLASIGPFALGPLIALGLKNSPFYQDAIYFYLHFQMNGFMFLCTLGLLASASLTLPLSENHEGWLKLFIYTTIPLYFMFTLWDNPNGWIRILAFAGAALQLISWLVLCRKFRRVGSRLSGLVQIALIAATAKIIFQVLVCVPRIGQWAFLDRDLIIGYIHLLTLGVIMPLIIDLFIKYGFLKKSRILTVTGIFYIIITAAYLFLLFLQPLLSIFSISIPNYQLLLFLACLLLLPAGLSFLFSSRADH